ILAQDVGETSQNLAADFARSNAGASRRRRFGRKRFSASTGAPFGRGPFEESLLNRIRIEKQAFPGPEARKPPSFGLGFQPWLSNAEAAKSLGEHRECAEFG